MVRWYGITTSLALESTKSCSILRLSLSVLRYPLKATKVVQWHSCSVVGPRVRVPFGAQQRSRFESWPWPLLLFFFLISPSFLLKRRNGDPPVDQWNRVTLSYQLIRLNYYPTLSYDVERRRRKKRLLKDLREICSEVADHACQKSRTMYSG